MDPAVIPDMEAEAVINIREARTEETVIAIEWDREIETVQIIAMEMDAVNLQEINMVMIVMAAIGELVAIMIALPIADILKINI